MGASLGVVRHFTALLALSLCLALLGCGNTCAHTLKPTVVGASLPQPLTCHSVTGSGRCCSWVVDGCMQTFCESVFACPRWEYRYGTPVDGTQRQCPIPDGYVHVQIMRIPDWHLTR